MNVHSIRSIRSTEAGPTRPGGQTAFHLMLSVVAAACVLAFAPAAAQETDGTTPVAQAESARPNKDEKICRVEDVTGSRMRKRICHTQEQWDARERAAQNLVRELDGKPVRNVPLGD